MNANTHTIPSIHALYSRRGLNIWLQNRGLRATKALGQNFLIDRQILHAILDAIELPSNGTIIEIGPGLGHLTWQLLERGLNVTAIELDNTFISSLTDLDKLRTAESSTQTPSLNIIHRDALDINYSELKQERNADCVIGNLPYNISVPLLFELAMTKPVWNAIHIMIQKEVGDRILASPSTKDYGRLSIVLNYLCDAKPIRTVKPGAFVPPPNVSSVFLSLFPKAGIDREFVTHYLERLVMLGFRHRRKKLRSQLKNTIIQGRFIEDSFMKRLEEHFDLDCRAEEFSVGDWVRMAEFIRDQPSAFSADA